VRQLSVRRADTLPRARSGAHSPVGVTVTASLGITIVASRAVPQGQVSCIREDGAGGVVINAHVDRQIWDAEIPVQGRSRCWCPARPSLMATFMAPGLRARSSQRWGPRRSLSVRGAMCFSSGIGLAGLLGQTTAETKGKKKK
jgi:hypothetical protein